MCSSDLRPYNDWQLTDSTPYPPRDWGGFWRFKPWLSVGPEVGLFFGGGRQHAGGFEIPIGFLSGSAEEEYTKLKWTVYDQQVRHRIIAKIGAERSV